MALHVIKGSGAPTVPPTQIGEHYVDETNKKHYLSVGTSTPSDWHEVGTNTPLAFTQLTDTPSSYTGAANKQLYVNSNANGVEFRVPPAAGATAFTQLTDTPSSYVGQAGKFVRVNSGQTALEFTASSGGGGLSTIPQHHAFYADSTQGSDVIEVNRGNIDLPFATIKAACDYIQTLPNYGNDVYAVRIQPGTFVEQPFTVPIRTSVAGLDFWKTIVVPVQEAGNFITLSPFGNLANFIIEGSVLGTGPKVDVGIYFPIAYPFSITQMTINNCKVGLYVADGVGSNVDVIMDNCSFGDLGPCDLGIRIAGNANVAMNNTYGVGSGVTGTTAVEVVSGTFFHNKGRFLNYETAIKVISGRAHFEALEFIACLNAIKISEDGATANTEVKIGNSVFNAVGIVEITTAIEVFGDDTRVNISDSTFKGFDRGILASNKSNVSVRGASFTTADAPNAIGVASYEECRVKVSDTEFFGSSKTQTGGLGVDCSDLSYMELFSCMFFNFNTFCLVEEFCQLQIWSCGFEEEDKDPNIIGLIATGEGFAYIYDTYFQCATGFIAQETSLVVLTSTGLAFADLNFQQKDTAAIVLYGCEFNEDKLLVENWGYVDGNYNSIKPGDRGQIIIGKLKVGTAELGHLSALGTGNSFSRGMLVYEYNILTDTFTDVTEVAKNPEGDFGIPTVDADSAVYIGCSLNYPDLTAVTFSGLFTTLSVVPVLGAGKIVLEYWSGSSWSAFGAMLTLAQEPYSGTTLPDMQPGQSGNLRFSTQLPKTWETNDPILPPLGVPHFWVRVRVGSNWADQSWNYRIKITIPATSVFGALSSFQTYFDLSLITDVIFWNNTQVSGADLRITDEDGITQLPMELVDFDHPNKKGAIYFTKPGLTNAEDDIFFVYFGNPTAIAVPPNGEYGSFRVWKDYDLVLHGSGIGQLYDDSTVNGYDCTGTRITRSTTGKFVDQWQTDNTNGSGLYTPNVAALNNPGNILTHDVWFRSQVQNTNVATVTNISNTNTAKNDFWAISISVQGNLQYEMNATAYGSGVAITDSTYHLATLTFDSSATATNSLKGFLDGVQRTQQSIAGAISAGTVPVGIGNRGYGTSSSYLNGQIDEVRIARMGRTLAWHQTMYANMNNNATWLSVGAIEDKTSATGSSPIDVAPRWSQFKLWPDSAVVNVDGFGELFGKARYYRQLQLNILSYNAPAGTDAATTGEMVWLSQSFGVTARYALTATVTKRITAVIRYGNDIDTSSPLRFKIKYIPRNPASGDVLFKVLLSASPPQSLFTISDGAPLTSPYGEQEDLSIISIATNSTNRDYEKIVNINLPPRSTQLNSDTDQDLVWVSIMRMGGSALDTFPGNIDILTVDAFGVGYRLGEHTTF
jgi:hypothetical protein